MNKPRRIRAVLHVLAMLATVFGGGTTVHAEETTFGTPEVRDDSLTLRLQRVTTWLLGQAEIPTPIDSAFVVRVENRGFVEAIVEHAIDSVLLSGYPGQDPFGGGSRVGLFPDVITVEYPALAEPEVPSNPNEEELREYYKTLERRLAEAKRIKKEHGDILGKVFAGLFVKRMRVWLAVPTGGGDKGSPLLAEVDVRSRDLPSAPMTFDYVLAWECIQRAIRRKELGVTNVPGNTGFHLETSKRGSEDKDWIYQQYFVVDMWDPYERDERNRGRYCRTRVVMVLGRAKRNGDFKYENRDSGPEVDDVIHAVESNLNNCK